MYIKKKNKKKIENSNQKFRRQCKFKSLKFNFCEVESINFKYFIDIYLFH